MFLHKHDVFLTPLDETNEDDVRFLWEMQMDEEVRRLYRIPMPITYEAFKEKVKAGKDDKNKAEFLIKEIMTKTETGALCIDHAILGICSINGINWRDGSAWLGIGLVKFAQKRGFGYTVGQMGLEYAKNELRLHHLMAGVYHGNAGSVRLLEKLGFEMEGKLRENGFVGGQYVDTYIYGKVL